jgi:hypothetical protein
MIRRAALVLLLALAAAPAAPASAAVAYPTRLQVAADEFRLTFSRMKVPAGRVKIELVNYGEDPHDLRLRRIGGTRTVRIPETAPGERTTRTFRLHPGRFHVWCGTADHNSRGMHATLRVVKR